MIDDYHFIYSQAFGLVRAALQVIIKSKARLASAGFRRYYKLERNTHEAECLRIYEMIILNHTTKYLFIEWDDGWNTDFFTLPVIGFASTNLNFKSVFVRFVRVVRIPSPRFINFHLSSGGMIADNHFK